MSEPTIQRETIYEGAAHIVIDKTGAKAAWKYIFCEGSVTVELKRAEMDVQVAGFGRVANPATDETVEVTFTPSNTADAAILAWLYGSVFSAMPGTSWYGAADTPLSIHTMAGRLLTISNCRPTTFPALQFGIGAKRFSGSVTCTGILARGKARTAADALFSPWADEPFAAQPEEDSYPQQPVSAAWGLLPGVELHAMDSWTLTPQIQLRAVTLPNLGTVDWRVDSAGCEASATPATLAEAQLWGEAALGASRALGASTPGADLTLAEDWPGVTAVLKNAKWVNRPTVFDTQNPIAGSCLWRAFRKAANGAWAPAATLAATAQG